jgi:hypothetical protein
MWTGRALGGKFWTFSGSASRSDRLETPETKPDALSAMDATRIDTVRVSVAFLAPHFCLQKRCLSLGRVRLAGFVPHLDSAARLKTNGAAEKGEKVKKKNDKSETQRKRKSLLFTETSWSRFCRTPLRPSQKPDKTGKVRKNRKTQKGLHNMEHKRRKSEELIEAPILELQGSKFCFLFFFFFSSLLAKWNLSRQSCSLENWTWQRHRRRWKGIWFISARIFRLIFFFLNFSNFFSSPLEHCTFCHTLDYLPFQCETCQKFVCQSHRDHGCLSLSVDLRPAICPLCAEPVALKPSEDANAVVEKHILNNCDKRYFNLFFQDHVQCY